MTSSLGYEVIPKAISESLAFEAARTLPNQPKHQREKYDAVEIPAICHKITDEFVNVVERDPSTLADTDIRQNTDKSALTRLFHPNPVPSQPDHIFVGVFRETEADPKKLKTAERGEIYATIALTPLSSTNGWYTFYEGSRANNPIPAGDRSTATVNLDVGDAVVWRGDLIYFHSSGGGGIFQTIVYKVD